MSKSGIQKFLYRFDKDLELQKAYEEGVDETWAGFDLEPEERDALRDCDIGKLFRWGLHPVLIRNFTGTLKLDVAKAYKDGGIEA